MSPLRVCPLFVCIPSPCIPSLCLYSLCVYTLSMWTFSVCAPFPFVPSSFMFPFRYPFDCVLSAWKYPLHVCPFFPLYIFLLTMDILSCIFPLLPLRLCPLSMYVFPCVYLFFVCVSSPLSIYVPFSYICPFYIYPMRPRLRRCGNSAQWSLASVSIKALPNEVYLTMVWKLCPMRLGWYWYEGSA